MSKEYPLTAICRGCSIEMPRENMRLEPNGVMRDRQCKPCRLVTLKNSRKSQWVYAQYKKDHCESCKFTGLNCQLDVDHINGDHSDNAPENLQTLCANCHRLKSYKKQEGIYRINNTRSKNKVKT